MLIRLKGISYLSPWPFVNLIMSELFDFIMVFNNPGLCKGGRETGS